MKVCSILKTYSAAQTISIEPSGTLRHVGNATILVNHHDVFLEITNLGLMILPFSCPRGVAGWVPGNSCIRVDNLPRSLELNLPSDTAYFRIGAHRFPLCRILRSSTVFTIFFCGPYTRLIGQVQSSDNLTIIAFESSPFCFFH